MSGKFTKLPCDRKGHIVPRRVRQVLISGKSNAPIAFKYHSAQSSINDLMHDNDAKLQRRYGYVKPE